MRYRCLTDQELSALEDDFKRFLVTHGLYAKEWRALNAERPDKALEMVQIFSDVVFGSVVERAAYVIHRSPQDLKVFHFEASQIVLLGLKLLTTTVDLTQSPYLEDLGEAIRSAGPANVRLMRASKAYGQSREQEIFTLLEQGCEIGGADVFAHLAALYGA